MRLAALLMALTFFFSCNHKPELAKVWLFDAVDFPGENHELGPATGEGYLLFSQESFLSLEKNGKFTSYFGHYQQGQWQSSEGRLFLAGGDQTRILFEVRKLTDGELQLYYGPRGALYTFKGFKGGFNSEGENPFSYANNKWRQKPRRAQNDVQITGRLKNYCRFYEKYFAWGNRIGTKALQVNNVPGPLQIYSNGFELIHFTQQPYEWQQHFYDTTEVRKAYMKIYYIFQTDNLEWNRDNGNYKMFESAFHQLQQKLH